MPSLLLVQTLAWTLPPQVRWRGRSSNLHRTAEGQARVRQRDAAHSTTKQPHYLLRFSEHLPQLPPPACPAQRCCQRTQVSPAHAHVEKKAKKMVTLPRLAHADWPSREK